jgi:hypothetical protein
MMDIDGDWCFYREGIEKLRYVIGKLRDFETMTWAEIKARTGSHSISVGDIATKAWNRLVDIGRDQEDTLFSLRLGGEERVLGVRRNAILHLLWWDPGHEVCESHLKHT